MSALNLAVPDFLDLPPRTWFALFEFKLGNRGVIEDRARFTQLLPRRLFMVVEHLSNNRLEVDIYRTTMAAVLSEAEPCIRAELEALCQSLSSGDCARRSERTMRLLAATMDVFEKMKNPKAANRSTPSITDIDRLIAASTSCFTFRVPTRKLARFGRATTEGFQTAVWRSGAPGFMVVLVELAWMMESDARL
ncbi:MAG: hypothetical protein ACRDDF_11550 [Aeromonas sp.]